jgi:protein-S-isoprenylcysteine O-methyltransferase Ste14
MLLSVTVLVVSIAIDIDEPQWITGIGIACLVLAVVFALPPFFHLRRHGSTRQGGAYYATTRVVDVGVYALVRHPQYLGYGLLVLGFTCLDPYWAAILLAAGAVFSFHLQAVAEERYCSTQMGPDYDDYMKRVPRFNFFLGLMRVLRKDSG